MSVFFVLFLDFDFYHILKIKKNKKKEAHTHRHTYTHFVVFSVHAVQEDIIHGLIR